MSENLRDDVAHLPRITQMMTESLQFLGRRLDQIEAMRAGETAAANSVQAMPGQEKFCYCNDQFSLQMVSGGGSEDGLFGRITCKVDGQYVDYKRANSWPEQPAEEARKP